MSFFGLILILKRFGVKGQPTGVCIIGLVLVRHTFILDETKPKKVKVQLNTFMAQ